MSSDTLIRSKTSRRRLVILVSAVIYIATLTSLEMVGSYTFHWSLRGVAAMIVIVVGADAAIGHRRPSLRGDYLPVFLAFGLAVGLSFIPNSWLLWMLSAGIYCIALTAFFDSPES